MTNKPFLYASPLLPVGFRFPASYLEFAQQGNTSDLTPWGYLFSNMALSLTYYGAMLTKYPDKPLVPFAIIDDQSGLYNDGYVVLACFDGDDRSGDPKIYFHDYSNPRRVDWADRYCLTNFAEWLRFATEDSERYLAKRKEAHGE